MILSAQMGIKQEIERLRFTEQTRRDEETKQKKQLIQKIETTENQLWIIARDFAIPFAQKLQESGVVEVLNELIIEEDLRYGVGEWYSGNFFNRKRFHRKDPRPAGLEIVFEVKIKDHSTYRLLGFNLKPDKKPDPELSTKSLALDQLREYYTRYYTKVTSAGNSEIKMRACFVNLEWNFYSLGYVEGYEYDRLYFSLFHRDGTYVLEFPGGELFPEHSWNKKHLEQAVARAYINNREHRREGGHPDIGS